MYLQPQEEKTQMIIYHQNLKPKQLPIWLFLELLLRMTILQNLVKVSCVFSRKKEVRYVLFILHWICFVFFTGSGDGNLVKTTIKAIQLKANPEAIEEGNTEVLDMIDDLFDNFFDNCKEDMDEDDDSDDSDNDENPDENLDENPNEDLDEDSDENLDENLDENPDENPDEDINIELIQDEGHEDGKDEKIDDIEVKLMIKGIIGDLIPSVIKENIVEKVNVEIENEKKSDEEILEQSRLEKEFLEKRQKQNEERLELEKKERKWSEREKLRQEKNITTCAIKENSPKKAQQETEIDKNPDKTDDHTIPNNTEATYVSCVFTEKYFYLRAMYLLDCVLFFFFVFTGSGGGNFVKIKT